jgi:sulfur carrier protein
MADRSPSAPAQPAEPASAPVADLRAARVVVNGVSRVIPAGQLLPELLAALGLRAGSVVVERNGAALTPSETSDVRLADGDTLEIVRAVAGG